MSNEYEDEIGAYWQNAMNNSNIDGSSRIESVRTYKSKNMYLNWLYDGHLLYASGSERGIGPRTSESKCPFMCSAEWIGTKISQQLHHSAGA